MKKQELFDEIKDILITEINISESENRMYYVVNTDELHELISLKIEEFLDSNFS